MMIAKKCIQLEKPVSLLVVAFDVVMLSGTLPFENINNGCQHVHQCRMRDDSRLVRVRCMHGTCLLRLHPFYTHPLLPVRVYVYFVAIWSYCLYAVWPIKEPAHCQQAVHMMH